MNDDTLLEFPCDFPVKVMGRNTPAFSATARALVESHTGPLDEVRVREALSRNERFVSVTITVPARSKQQLDDIYRDLSAHKAVLMAL